MLAIRESQASTQEGTGIKADSNTRTIPHPPKPSLESSATVCGQGEQADSSTLTIEQAFSKSFSHSYAEFYNEAKSLLS